MTDTDQREKRPKWPIYVLSGCGVLLLFGIVAVICMCVIIGAHFKVIAEEIVNPKPIVRSTPYHFGDEDQAAKVSINLPDDYGVLVYQHKFLDSRLLSGGNRALLLRQGNHVKQEWPLLYYPLEDVRVGVYWYRAQGNQGPILRFYDAAGESVLDLGQNEVGQIARSHGRVFVGYYEYNDHQFRSGLSERRSSSGSVTYQSVDGTPADDITARVSPDSCTYLGSIVRKGDKLVFVPNPKK